jgi:hypothetical protein
LKARPIRCASALADFSSARATDGTAIAISARLLVFAMPGIGLDRMFAAFDAASKRRAPAIDTVAEIAKQYGVVIHPPSG